MMNFAKIAFASSVAGGALLGAVEPAAAIEVGPACVTASNLMSQMKAEGFSPVVYGDSKKSGYGRIVFFNPEKRTGYYVFKDDSSEKRSDCSRIGHFFKRATLFDARLQGVDPAALTASDIEKSRRACVLVQKNDKECGPHNELLKTLDDSGFHVYFQGAADIFHMDGSLEGESLLTIVGRTDSDDNPGKLLDTKEGPGLSWQKDAYSFVAYTDQAYEIMKGRKRLTENTASPKIQP